MAGRKTRAGRRCISAGRRSSVWSHACFRSTPTARDRAGFVPAGMFRHSTLPLSITSSSGGSRRATAPVSAAGEEGNAGAPACSLAGLSGQKVAATSGRSKTERKTLRPSMMPERSFASMVSQSCAYQRFTASSRSRRAGSAGAGRSISNGVPSSASRSRSAASSVVRNVPSLASFHDQAGSSSPCGARSAIRTRTCAGGSTSAPTSAILPSIRSGSSVHR